MTTSDFALASKEPIRSFLLSERAYPRERSEEQAREKDRQVNRGWRRWRRDATRRA